jgi:hypothetical protein
MGKVFNSSLQGENEAPFSISIFQIIWITYCQQILVMKLCLFLLQLIPSFSEVQISKLRGQAPEVNRAVVALDNEGGDSPHT